MAKLANLVGFVEVDQFAWDITRGMEFTYTLCFPKIRRLSLRYDLRQAECLKSELLQLDLLIAIAFHIVVIE